MVHIIDDLMTFNKEQPYIVGKDRLCRDCKYARVGWLEWIMTGWRFAKCFHKSSTREYEDDDLHDTLVTGKIKVATFRTTNYCSCHRYTYSTLDTCGVEGKYWEPKK